MRYYYQFLLITIASILFILPDLKAQQTVPEQDSLALVDYYNAMQGEFWEDQYKMNWLETSIDQWINVGVENGRVTTVTLPFMGGDVPESIYNLTELIWLILEDRGHINETPQQSFFPAGINALTKLTSLHINGYGSTPMEIDFMHQVGSLTELTSMIITVDKINHSLPENIGNAPNLSHMRITANEWSTLIPSSITQLTLLNRLIINGQINGEIPENIGNLRALYELELLGGLAGTIPESIGQLDSLSDLTIANGSLSGPIPSGIFDLDLQDLDLSNNNLESIPANFLQYDVSDEFRPTLRINLSHNNISGELPETISLVESDWLYNGLRVLNLSHNQFSGELPSWVSEIGWLEFDVSYNDFEGEIPVINHSMDFDYELDPPENQHMFVNNNRFTSMAQFPERSILGLYKIYCAGNLLSFDDLIKNREVLREKEVFSPQESITLGINDTVETGGSYRVELGIDGDIAENRYYWFKDDEQIEVTEINYLDILDFDESKAGQYRVEVRYESAGEDLFDELVLHFDGIALEAEPKSSQQITFELIADKTVGDEDFLIVASSNSGLDVELMVIEGEDFVEVTSTSEGYMISIIGAGTVVLEVTQDGNNRFEAAEPVRREFSISEPEEEEEIEEPTDPEEEEPIDEEEPETPGEGDEDEEQPEEPVDPEEPIDEEESENPDEEEEQPEEPDSEDDTEEEPEEEVEEPIAEEPESELEEQVITYDTSLANTVFIYGSEPIALDINTSSGLPVNVIVTGAEYIDSEIIITRPGTVTVRIIQDGDDKYLAEEVSFSFVVDKAEQSIMFSTSDLRHLTDTTYLLNAKSDRDLEVSYRVVSGSATIDNNLLTAHQEGDITIEAYNSGNEFYKGDTVTQTLRVNIITSTGEELDKQIAIYPNPVVEYIYIKGSYEENATFGLFELNGSQKMSGDIQEQINLSNLKQGVYLLIIESKKGRVEKKIIKY